MKLTRAQLRNELATLEAQHLANSAVIGRLLAEVHRLRGLDTTNVRLAAQVEQLELHVQQLEAMSRYEHTRLARFLADHPDLFRRAS